MLFIQNGPAWRPKCEELLDKKIVDGIIWDLRNENIDKINEKRISDKNFNNIINLADLKIYYQQFPNSIKKKLIDLPYMPDYQITRFSLRDRKNLEKIVKDTIDFQINNNFDIICIPALYITSFDERMIDAIFELLLSYKDYLDNTEKKVYLDLLIHESAFNRSDQLDEFINELSTYKNYIDGIYMTIDRETGNSIIRNEFDSTKLCNLMQFIYYLKLMKLEVLVGYCGIESINLVAAGADYIGTGWFHSLRKFNKVEKGLEPTERRGKAKKRYTSINFLSELVIDENIWQYNNDKKDWLYDVALNNLSLDKKIKNENLDDISFNETYIEYFETLNLLFNKIKDAEIENRLTNLLELIKNAIDNIEEYNKNNLIGSPLTKKHLESYQLALTTFAYKNFIEL